MSLKILKIKKAVDELFNYCVVKYANSLSLIDWGKSSQFIKEKLQDLQDNIIEKDNRLKNIKDSVSEEEIINKIKSLEVNNESEWIEAVKSQNNTEIFDLYLTYSRDKDYSRRKIARDIVEYVEAMSLENNRDFNIDENFEEIKKRLENKFKTLEKLIIDAISRVADWKKSSIKIVPQVSEDDFFEEDSRSGAAEVQFENNISFTIFFENDTIQIDDKLEFGDEDFFTEQNKDIASDYFSLIQELEIPGSSSRNKKKTLYTSRPTKDREYYLKNNELPAGIFLTTSLDFAEFFGEEYGQKRDVWKVKLNTKDLVLTLDDNKQKQYQLLRTVIPESMELIHAS